MPFPSSGRTSLQEPCAPFLCQFVPLLWRCEAKLSKAELPLVGRGARGHKHSGSPGSNRSRQVSQPHPLASSSLLSPGISNPGFVSSWLRTPGEVSLCVPGLGCGVGCRHLHRLLGTRRHCGSGGKPTTSADAWLSASPTCVVQLVLKALEETRSKHTPLLPGPHVTQCSLDCDAQTPNFSFLPLGHNIVTCSGLFALQPSTLVLVYDLKSKEVS